MQSILKLPNLVTNYSMFSKLYSHDLSLNPVMNKYETERRINQLSIDTICSCVIDK